MKLITDEQYAAINHIISNLNDFFIDRYDKTILEYHIYPVDEDEVEVSLRNCLEIIYKSLKEEPWAKPEIKWKPLFDPNMFVTKREVALEKIVKKMAKYIEDKYGYDSTWSIKELKEITKLTTQEN